MLILVLFDKLQFASRKKGHKISKNCKTCLLGRNYFCT